MNVPVITSLKRSSKPAYHAFAGAVSQSPAPKANMQPKQKCKAPFSGRTVFHPMKSCLFQDKKAHYKGDITIPPWSFVYLNCFAGFQNKASKYCLMEDMYIIPCKMQKNTTNPKFPLSDSTMSLVFLSCEQRLLLCG